METYKTANPKSGIFKWRSSDTGDHALDAASKSRWRRYDVSMVFILLMTTLVTIYRADHDGPDRRETVVTSVLDITLWLLILWLVVRLLKSYNPQVFFYERDCIADIFEQKERDSFKDTTHSKGIDFLKEKLIDSSSTNHGPIMRPVCRDASSQTEGNQFLMDIKRTERGYQREMRRLRRQMWRTKQNMRKQLRENCKTVRNQGHQLADYQLQLLPLKARKEYLLAEKAKLEQELGKEQSRHQDLLSRLKKLEMQVLSYQVATETNFFEIREQTGHSGWSSDTDSQGETFHSSLIQALKSSQIKDPQMSNLKTVYGQEETIINGHAVSKTKLSKRSKKPKEVFSLPKTVNPRSKDRDKVRMLYSVERGENDEVKYVAVTPMLNPLYETGSELFPSETIEQMEIIARPHPDGTLRLLHMSRYTDGFPREVLDSSVQYMDINEYHTSRGISPRKHINPTDILFQSL